MPDDNQEATQCPPLQPDFDAQGLLRGILDNAEAAIFVCDEKACLQSVNRAYERMTGYSAAQILGHTVHELFQEQDARTMHQAVREVFTQGRAATFEATFTFQGRRRWFLCSLFPLPRTGGGQPSVAGIAAEITERKLFENKLSTANRALSVLNEASRAVIRAKQELALARDVCRITVATGGYQLACVGLLEQDKAARLLPVAQYSQQQGQARMDKPLAMLQRLSELPDKVPGTPGHALSTLKPSVAREIAGSMEFATLAPLACEADFNAALSIPVGLGQNPLGLLLICSNEPDAFQDAEVDPLVSLADNLAHGIRSLRAEKRRDEVEDALRKSEALYRALFEKSSEGVFLHDLAGNILEVNQAGQQMLGYSLDELRRLHPAQLVRPEEIQGIAEGFEGIARNESQVAEYRCLRKDGSEIEVIAKGKKVSPNLIQVIVQDVTEHKKAERALQQSEARYRAVVEDQTEVISRFRNDGSFVFVNDVYCRVFGKHREELLQGAWQPVCLPEDLPHVEKELARLGPENPVISIENRVIDGQGRIVWMQFVNRGFFNQAGELMEIQSVGRDITRQKQLQAEAIRSARLASLGELAAGVAHEVNNPLNGIINCAQLLADEARSMERDPRFAELILQEGRRVAQIVSSLLCLARDDELRVEPLNPELPLLLALDLMRTQMEKVGIELHLQTQSNLPCIMANKGRLQQVFLNLLRNAHQAILRQDKKNPREKRVRISIDNNERQGKAFVRYTLQDTGQGLLPEHLDRLFDPFFSTRAHAEGTGLGLCISRNIVEEYKGHIELQSNEQGGATAIVELPAKQGAQS